MSIKTHTSNKIAPNLENLPLTEYFKNLPKATRIPIIVSSPKNELIDIIATATHKDRHTVRRWMYGYTVPSGYTEKKIVAEILQSTVETLFPEPAPAAL